MEADFVSLLELLIPSASQYNQCSAEPTAGRRKARTALTCSAVSDVLSLLLCRVSMGGGKVQGSHSSHYRSNCSSGQCFISSPILFQSFSLQEASIHLSAKLVQERHKPTCICNKLAWKLPTRVTGTDATQEEHLPPSSTWGADTVVSKGQTRDFKCHINWQEINIFSTKATHYQVQQRFSSLSTASN